jgi:septal ring factor EnvC (AmiA/AmiB activator)
MFFSSKERIAELEQALSEARAEIQSLRQELESMHKEAKKLQMQKGFFQIMLEDEQKIKVRLSKQLAEAEQNRCPPKKHNERGAGRKPRATPQIIETLLNFKGQGFSLKQMDGELAVQTGQPWSKSTVAHILKSHGNKK